MGIFFAGDFLTAGSVIKPLDVIIKDWKEAGILQAVVERIDDEANQLLVMIESVHGSKNPEVWNLRHTLTCIEKDWYELVGYNSPKEINGKSSATNSG